MADLARKEVGVCAYVCVRTMLTCGSRPGEIWLRAVQAQERMM